MFKAQTSPTTPPSSLAPLAQPGPEDQSPATKKAIEDSHGKSQVDLSLDPTDKFEPLTTTVKRDARFPDDLNDEDLDTVVPDAFNFEWATYVRFILRIASALMPWDKELRAHVMMNDNDMSRGGSQRLVIV